MNAAVRHTRAVDAPGLRHAFAHDPEGHEIEMIQLTRPAAARE
jgi:hypothetical protein